MANTINEKTVGWLRYKIECELEEFYKNLPDHNNIFNDTRVNYRNKILENKLRTLSYPEKNTLVNYIEEKDTWSIKLLLYGIQPLN